MTLVNDQIYIIPLTYPKSDLDQSVRNTFRMPCGGILVKYPYMKTW